MTKYKITIKEGCTGCGACVATCPNNWQMKDSIARPKKTTIDEKELKCNKEAAEVCPVDIIKIEKV